MSATASVLGVWMMGLPRQGAPLPGRCWAGKCCAKFLFPHVQGPAPESGGCEGQDAHLGPRGAGVGFCWLLERKAALKQEWVFTTVQPHGLRGLQHFTPNFANWAGSTSEQTLTHVDLADSLNQPQASLSLIRKGLKELWNKLGKEILALPSEHSCITWKLVNY